MEAAFFFLSPTVTVAGGLLGARLFLAALLGCLGAVGPVPPLGCGATKEHGLLGQSLEGLACPEAGEVQLLVRVGTELEQVTVKGPEPALVSLHLRAPGQLPADTGIEVFDFLVAPPVDGVEVLLRPLTIVVSLEVETDAVDDAFGRRGVPARVLEVVVGVVPGDEVASRLLLPPENFILALALDEPEDVGLLLQLSSATIATYFGV